jgi:hypothetical protein
LQCDAAAAYANTVHILCACRSLLYLLLIEQLIGTGKIVSSHNHNVNQTETETRRRGG